MRILAIGCHPDDLEIGCYGTLAKYVRLGHEVSVCHVANGNLGHVEIMPDELRKMRFEEAEEASHIIGAKKHYCVDIGDLYVTAENDELVRRLAAVVREAQPELIITHSDHDYMNDHMQTYYAALRASFAASLPHFDLTATTPVSPTCPIYHMDPVAGTGFIPTEYVDISDTIELKLKALACHHTQIDWMRDHDHIDFLEFVRTCSRVRGFQSGVDYAEGFRPNFNHLRMTTKRLLP